MYTFIVILILLVCVLLSVVVLLQNSKGGGLAANFSAPNQVLGVRKTTDVFEKATWILAAALVVLSLCATIAIKGFHTEAAESQSLETNISISDNNLNPTQQAAPAATAEAPVAE